MNENKSHFDVFRYLGIVKRRKWFFIIPVIVIYISFMVLSFLLPKIYEARAIILVEEKKVVNPLLSRLAVSTTVASRLNALREEILAWPRIFQLVERLKLNKDVKTPLELERLIAGIRRNIGLQMRSNEVVIIAYRDKDPKSTQKLVNTLCDILIERNKSIQAEDTESAIGFINEQLAIYKEKLDKSEEELRKFKEVYGMGMLSERRMTTSDQKGTSIPEDSPAGVTLFQINQQLANLEAELVMASIDCTDEHPRITGIKRRIESLEEKRREYIEEAAQKTGVEATAYIEIADSFPRQQEELTRLTRGKAINERIYAMLLERMETAKITERLDASENRTKFRIIEPARLPLMAKKPNKVKYNLLGIILGGMVGFGFVYLLEFTDSSFKSEDDLKNMFGYPVLGNISRIITEDDLNKKRKFASKVTFITGIIIILVIFTLIMVMRKGVILPKVAGFIQDLMYKVASKI